jgi:hypothetical protein
MVVRQRLEQISVYASGVRPDQPPGGRPVAEIGLTSKKQAQAPTPEVICMDENDERQVVAVLVAPSASGWDGVIGSGILIDPRLAVIAVDQDADDMAINALEVIIAPAEPVPGDRIERIRPSLIRFAEITTEPPQLMAAVALSHPSRRDGIEAFEADEMVAAFEGAGGVLEGFHSMGRAVALPPRGAELVDHVGRVNEIERDPGTLRIERWERTSPYSVARFCCKCSPKCQPHEPPGDEIPFPGPGPRPGPGGFPPGHPDAPQPFPRA